MKFSGVWYLRESALSAVKKGLNRAAGIEPQISQGGEAATKLKPQSFYTAETQSSEGREGTGFLCVSEIRVSAVLKKFRGLKMHAGKQHVQI